MTIELKSRIFWGEFGLMPLVKQTLGAALALCGRLVALFGLDWSIGGKC